MRCRGSTWNGLGRESTPCLYEAVQLVWCPTWITKDPGPHPVCFEHAKKFKSEFNKYANDADFHWDDDAIAAHAAWAAAGNKPPTVEDWCYGRGPFSKEKNKE